MTGPVSEPSTNKIVTDLIAVLREGLTNVTWHARVRPALVALAVTGDAVWESPRRWSAAALRRI
jgi:hypothetical protein